MNSNHGFNKLAQILKLCPNSEDDVTFLVDSILKWNNDEFWSQISSTGSDDELVDDVLHLADGLREEGTAKHTENLRVLVNTIAAKCLAAESQNIATRIVQRLYRRGFAHDLANAVFEYYSSVVKTDAAEDLEYSAALGNSDSSLMLCCNVLRNFSKCVYAEQGNTGPLLRIKSVACHNVVKRVVGLMSGSCLKVGGKWNVAKLADLFHPLSRTHLPCLVLYCIVDTLPDEARLAALESTASFYADAELMRATEPDKVACIAGGVSRLLAKTKTPRGYAFGTLSNLLTKGITYGMTTLDPIVRTAAMTVAEAYSLFLYNNSEDQDSSLLLEFDSELKTESQVTLTLKAYKSEQAVGPDLPATTPSIFEPQEQGGEEKNEDANNQSFIDMIFGSVPEIKAQTVKGYVKEYYLKPPSHIVQCYERLLSKPAAGDTDFECIVAHPLDRPGDETVENKILRMSQTLLYLPQVIRKNESMLDIYAPQLSNVLIKLDDLELYREKISEIADTSGPVVNETLSITEETAPRTSFVSKDPETLVIVSLALITYHCPETMTKFYAEHLFDSEYTLSMRITMLLCIQYTAMALNAALDPDALTRKVVTDKLGMSLGQPEISSIQTANSGLSNGKDKPREIRVVTCVPSEYKPIPQLPKSSVLVRKFNNRATSFLLDSLMVFANRTERAPMDEDVAIGIFETLIVFISSGSLREETLDELREMVEKLSTDKGGHRFKRTLETIGVMVANLSISPEQGHLTSQLINF